MIFNALSILIRIIALILLVAATGLFIAVFGGVTLIGLIIAAWLWS